MKFVVFDHKKSITYVVDADSKDEAIITIMDKLKVKSVEDDRLEAVDVETRLEQLNKTFDEWMSMGNVAQAIDVSERIFRLKDMAGIEY